MRGTKDAQILLASGRKQRRRRGSAAHNYKTSLAWRRRRRCYSASRRRAQPFWGLLPTFSSLPDASRSQHAHISPSRGAGKNNIAEVSRRGENRLEASKHARTAKRAFGPRTTNPSAGIGYKKTRRFHRENPNVAPAFFSTASLFIRTMRPKAGGGSRGR